MSRPAVSGSRERSPAAPQGAVSFLPAGDALQGALLDSRQRWRDLVTLAADLAFETDAEGRFVFLAPDPVLGWPVAALLGRLAAEVLADAGEGADPFRPTSAIRDRRAWVKRADGGTACLRFAAVPLRDATGGIAGARGIGQDVTDAERREADLAAALRRARLIEHILARMRAEVLAPRMMQAALAPLAQATGAAVACVVDVVGDGMQPAVLHAQGTLTAPLSPPALAAAGAALAGEALSGEAGTAVAADGHLLLGCPAVTRFGERVGLLLVRPPGARAWDADDAALVRSAAVVIRTILEHDAIQREMARQARTDPLTGLYNRRAFMDEIARHIDRLDREHLPGALLFIDLDHFKALNDRLGHEAGDAALHMTALLLRGHTRPGDLLARLGGDEFAVWLDGADHFAAAERAETLRLNAARAFAELAPSDGPALSMSIGIAARWPGQGEDIEALLGRADQAMYAVKRTGRGQWRVAPTDDAATDDAA